MSTKRFEMLLAQFGTWGYDTRGWSPRTREKYTQRMRALERSLRAQHGKSVLWATQKDLRTWLFNAPPDPRTRNNYRQAAVAFFEFLVEAGYVDTNHALCLPRLPEPETLSDALTREQAYAIEQASKLYPPMQQALVAAFLYVALRRTEARLLEWMRLDLEDGWLRFTAKGRRDRVLPLGARAAAIFRRWRAECPDLRWSFPSPREHAGPVSDTWVRMQIRGIGEAAGVPGLHPHQLRHTFATRFVDKGGDIRTLQEILGHRSIATTQRYLRVRPVRLREWVDFVDYDPDDA